MLRIGRVSTFAIAAVCAASLGHVGPAQAQRGVAIGIGAGIVGGLLLGEALRNQQAQQRQQAAPRSYRRSTERAESSPSSSSRSSKRASAKKSGSPEPVAASEADLSRKEIAEAQRALNILGFEAGTETSGQGPKFDRAVKAFQGLLAEPRTGKLSRLQLAELQRRADAADQPKLAEPQVERSGVPTALADPAPSRRASAPEVRDTGSAPAPTAKVNHEDASQRFQRIMDMGQDRIGRFFYVEKSEIASTGRIKVTVRKTVVSTDMSRPLPESRELSGSIHNLIAVHDAQDPTLAHLMYYQADQNRSLVLFTVSLQESDATRTWAESLQRDIDQIAEMHGDITDPFNNLKKLRRTELARR